MKWNNAIVVFALVSLYSLAGCDKSSESTGASAVDADARCPHEIKQAQCPFCNPELIESDGFCGEHGVAEALCAVCRPYLKAAFRAQDDWCAEHSLPESQCMTCNPELKENIRPGGHGTASPDDGG